MNAKELEKHRDKFESLKEKFMGLSDYTDNIQKYRAIYRRIKQNMVDIIEGKPYHIKVTDIPVSIREDVSQILTELEG